MPTKKITQLFVSTTCLPSQSSQWQWLVYVYVVHNCIIVLDALFSYSACLRNARIFGHTDGPILCNYCIVLHGTNLSHLLAIPQQTCSYTLVHVFLGGHHISACLLC